MFTALIHFILSGLSTIAFGVITNIPQKTLLAAGFTGACGWVCYYYTRTIFSSDAFGNFLGALLIGLLAIFFSRRLKYPTIIFNIPALVPLVPGGPAYQAVRSLVLDDQSQTFGYVVKVIVTAGAIAAGFMLTSLAEKKLLRHRVR